MKFGKFTLEKSIGFGLVLLLGRVMGLVREIQLGAVFGLSKEADYAVLLLTLPDLLVGLLLSGGLSVALIPEFRNLPKGKASALLFQVAALVTVVFSAIALFIWVFPHSFIALIAPGYVLDTAQNHQRLIGIAALALPLTALSGVTTAVLNAHDRFFISGAGTLIFNLCIIAALFLPSHILSPLEGLVWAIVLGAAVRWVSQLIVLPRTMFRPDTAGWLINRDLLVHFSTALLSASVVLLVPVLMRALASLIGEGAIAALNFATKLIELPLGIAITTISTVAFPILCEHINKNDSESAKAVYARYLQRALIIATAIMIPSIWFADEFTRLIFGRGSMSEVHIQHIATMARIGFLSLPFIALSSMATAVMNAQKRTPLLLKMTLVSLLCMVGMALPGMYMKNINMLMCSLVGFHAVLAFFLNALTGYPVSGNEGWITKHFLKCMSVVIAGCSAWILFDTIVKSLPGVVHAVGGGLCIVVCCFFGVRLHGRGMAETVKPLSS